MKPAIRLIADAQPWLGVGFGHRAIDAYLKPGGDFSKEHAAGSAKAWGILAPGAAFGPLGFCAIGIHTILNRSPRLALPSVYIKALAIHPDHRRKGLGKALMRHALLNALRAAEHIPITSVHLLPAADRLGNHPQLGRFYASLGFSPMPESPSFWKISIADLRQAAA